MKKALYFASVICVLLVACKKETVALDTVDETAYARPKHTDAIPFMDQITVYQNKDKLNYPAPDGLLFIGSSSIRLWDNLEQHFPDKNIIRRGLGGSLLYDWAQYYIGYALPYKPRKIFIYAGENDFAFGQTPTDIAASFEKVRQIVQNRYPNTIVYYLSLKPSPARMARFQEGKLVNSLIKTSIATKPNAYFIDLASCLLKPNTMVPDSAYFGPDMIHLNETGYAKWENIIKKYLD